MSKTERSMKKIYSGIFALAAILPVSCNKEMMEETPHQEYLTISASIVPEEDETTVPAETGSRTTIAFSNKIGTISWASGDQISVLNSKEIFDDFTLSAGVGSPDGQFTGVFSDGASVGKMAVYPAGVHRISGEQLTVNLPVSYGSKNINYSRNTNAIMLAEAEGNNFPFRHLGGVIGIKIVKTPAGTDEVRLSGAGVSGDFVVRNDGTDNYIEKSPDAIGSRVSRLFKPTTREENKTFYFPLPTGTYDKFTVSIYYGGKVKRATIKYDAPKTVRRADYVGLPDLDASLLKEVDESGINASVFELLDLDYPGLEAVRDNYNTGNLSKAASELLKYYRNRTGIRNINVSDSPTCSNVEKNKADQATRAEGFRFYVKNFIEDKGGSGEADDRYYSFLGEDGNIDWTLIPDAVAGNQEWKQRYRLQWMLPQAKAYAVHKDEKYVQAWKEILTSLMSTCNNYKNADGTFVTYKEPNKEPYNVAWAALQVTARLEDMLTVFEYYKHSENFTPEWLTVFLAYIYDHMESMLANPYNAKGQYSNIITAQHSCKVQAGLYFPEFKDAAYWFNLGASALIDDVYHQFNEDGVLCEFDYGYHVGTLADYIGVYNAVQANLEFNPKLAYIFNSGYTSRLRNAANFVQDYIYPNYTVEGFADTRPADTGKSVIKRNLTQYNGMFPDDGHFLWMSSERQSGEVPAPHLPEDCPQDLQSLSIYPASGYYMFRSGWDSRDIMLIHKNNNDPDARTHNDWDNGTISLYKDGRRFMPDAGVPTYGGSEELDAKRAEYASSAKHSTITRNERQHTKRAGRYLGAGKASNYEYVVTENEFDVDAANGNLSHRRAIFFVDNTFFVLLDEVHGSRKGGDMTLKMMLGDGGFDSEYAAEKNSEAKTISAYSRYSDNNNMYYKSFAFGNAPNTDKTTYGTDYYFDNVTTLANWNVDRKKRAYYKITATKPGATAAVRFITVICPFSSSAPAEVSAEFTADTAIGSGTGTTFSAAGASAKVTLNGTEYNLSYIIDSK